VATTDPTDKPTIFVAPSERHPALTKLADKVSNLPEKYGCDIIWRAHNQWWGVQRKEIKDFIASILDGRLAKEVGQMQGHVSLPIVAIEGKVQWSDNGTLMHSSYGKPVTKAQYNGMLFSLMLKGVQVMFTANPQETADLCRHLAEWSQKETHNSMDRRPGPDQASVWGKATNMDWAKHLLQGFPGIGPQVASDIIKHFGRVPLQWTVTPAELLKVPGVGPTRAKALIESFDVGE